MRQLEEEANRYEDQMKEYQLERKKFIDQIREIDHQLILTKQTIEQRHLIIQEKVSFRLFYSFSFIESLV